MKSKRRTLSRGGYSAISASFAAPQIGTQIQEFFRSHKLPDELMQPLAQSLSTIEECSILKARMQPNLHTWLLTRN
jgi:hypothetical protein